jgi:uncharacterized protein YjiK
MKINIYAAFILFLVFAGCKRSDPQDAGGPPSSDTALTPLAVYNISVSEPSGLAYCPKTNTLYMVSDGFQEIYEMSLKGEILRTIPVTSPDMEGIVLSKNYDTLLIVEEGNYQVVKYLQDGTRVGSFKDVTGPNTKHAIEGITIDDAYKIYLLNEKDPCRLVCLSYDGTELWRKDISYTLDISEVCYDKKTDCLWMLSDESKALMKLSKDGNLLQRWDIPIEQAEGLAMTEDKIYIVSDQEAKMYVFNRP